MPRYVVFGEELESSVAIPELRPASAREGAAAWHFAVADGPAPMREPQAPLAEDELAAGVRARLFRHGATLRLEFDDTGVFDLATGNRSIVWYPRPGCEHDVGRADLVGRVLPLAHHERGLLALHASAVCVGGGTLAFMAPKNHGKSSLSLALITGTGARLLTDDTLLVSPESAVALPGVHSVRLWEETAERFSGLGPNRPVLSDKRIFEQLPEHMLAHEPSPVAALYTLQPAPASDAVPVRRTRLDGPSATIALIQYQKLAGLLAGAEAARVFQRAAALAARVAVYELHVARDLARLPDVAREIAAWHAP